MLEYLLLAVAALVVAALTLLTGFGLGSLLLPVFAFLLPIELAVAATAVVHLANNLFKLGLVGRGARPLLVLRFGVPAVAAAVPGAWLLAALAAEPPLLGYELAGRSFQVTPVELVIAAVMAVFALLDLHPALDRIALPARYLPLGGVASGFFGGLSGHQGALRAVFLSRADLTGKQYVGTNVVLAVLVDLARLAVYSGAFGAGDLRVLSDHLDHLFVATGAAFLGSFVASRLLGRVTMVHLRRLVGGLLLLIAVGIASGLV